MKNILSVIRNIDYSFFYRKKIINYEALSETQLSRVLTTVDLTALGIGSTLGAGIYVLAGSVIKDITGPSIIISFMIAAFASILAALCYAEFGSQVPKSGSAYVYTYVTVGELMAFVIGWNLILEYLIGTASVARAFSSYFDSLTNNKIQTFFREHMPINTGGLSPYPDFFAFGITCVVTTILSIGVKESTRFNNIFTAINLLVVAFIIISGAIKVNFDNWKLIPNDDLKNFTHLVNTTHSEKYGTGGFFPFGFAGTLAGAAKCFYAFIGFDCIATTGEETINPQKAIPLSIILSLIICTVAYCLVSGILSLMVPYYMIDSNAPLPEAFRVVKWDWARWIVAIGAICSLSTSLLGSMFPLPRVLYAISDDGLIFKLFSVVNSKLKTPLYSTILSGLFAGFLSMIFDLDQLVNMMSIGTLLAYSLVAIAVVVLRYQPTIEESLLANKPPKINFKTLHILLFKPDVKEPNKFTSKLVNFIVFLCTTKSTYFLFLIIEAIDIIIICIVLITTNLENAFEIVLLVIFILIEVVLIVILMCQPQTTKELSFKIPLLPIIPLLSVFINFYLMMVLTPETWVRFGVWMAIGFSIYFFYGTRHSLENIRNKSVSTVNLNTYAVNNEDETKEQRF